MTAAVLPPRPVQVWWARLADAHPDLVGLLDPVERGRYEATADPGNRRRFLAGCAVSRVVLGELLDLRPADVPLRRVCGRCGGPHGKVTLDVPTGSVDADVRFSVSHSGDVIGFAVCRGADVGLDVEDGAGDRCGEGGPRVLADTELAALHARPAAERPHGLSALLDAQGVRAEGDRRRFACSAAPTRGVGSQGATGRVELA